MIKTYLYMKDYTHLKTIPVFANQSVKGNIRQGGRTTIQPLTLVLGFLRRSLHTQSLLIPSISVQGLPICSINEIYGRPTGLLCSWLSLTERT